MRGSPSNICRVGQNPFHSPLFLMSSLLLSEKRRRNPVCIRIVRQEEYSLRECIVLSAYSWVMRPGRRGHPFKAARAAVCRGTVPKNKGSRASDTCVAPFSTFDSLVSLLASPQIFASAACTSRGHRPRKPRQSQATKCLQNRSPCTQDPTA
jgi:hypothetical protein